MKQFFKTLYKYWMIFAKKIAIIPTTIILSFLYFGIISIIALITFISRKDLLDKRAVEKKSFWLAKEHIATDLERCKRQF